MPLRGPGAVAHIRKSTLVPKRAWEAPSKETLGNRSLGAQGSPIWEPSKRS
jgi:hypothetical protein